MILKRFFFQKLNCLIYSCLTFWLYRFSKGLKKTKKIKTLIISSLTF